MLDEAEGLEVALVGFSSHVGFRKQSLPYLIMQG